MPVASVRRAIPFGCAARARTTSRTSTLAIPLNELVVVTGVSGSGKSSLVFDTLYAEGQRRYVETFSPYARQFLDRMDKPQVDRIDGIPPAIAIDQTNPVRTSRSTVGTMTELNDHLKLLFARAARLYCRGCGQPVRATRRRRSTPRSPSARKAAGDPRLDRHLPGRRCRRISSEDEVQQLLEQPGLHAHPRAAGRRCSRWCRTGCAWRSAERARVIEALEAALQASARAGERLRRSTKAHDAPALVTQSSSSIAVALLLRPALRRLRHPLRGPDAEPVLVQLAARRLRHLPRLRPRDRHRLRPGGARRSARRCATARSGRGRRRASTNARTTW